MAEPGVAGCTSNIKVGDCAGGTSGDDHACATTSRWQLRLRLLLPLLPRLLYFLVQVI